MPMELVKPILKSKIPLLPLQGITSRVATEPANINIKSFAILHIMQKFDPFQLAFQNIYWFCGYSEGHSLRRNRLYPSEYI